MVNWISSWAQGIIIAVIISTIIEMILPEGNIKKYVKTVIGVYIVFIIISPIITKFIGKEIKLSSYKMPEMQSMEVAQINTNSYIEGTYINKIKQDMVQNIENKGYKVLEVKIEAEKKEENYGNIIKIKLLISKNIADASNIKPIEINISEKEQKGETINNEEIENLKVYLKENYGTPMKDIIIDFK